MTAHDAIRDIIARETMGIYDMPIIPIESLYAACVTADAPKNEYGGYDDYNDDFNGWHDDITA